MDPIVPSCNTDQGVYRGCKRFWKEVGKHKKFQTSFYYPQSRNESDPQQKAGNSAVFYFLNKSHTGVALPTKPLYFSLFPFRKKKEKEA